MAYSITSANSVVMMTIPPLYSSPQQLQGFAVDDGFVTEITDATETQTGVDGFGVAGFVPRSPMMTFRFLASSASVLIFETWLAAMDALNDVYYCGTIISLPSVGRQYTGFQGTLTRVTTMPDARKILNPREFHIQFLPGGPGVPAIASAPI